MDALTKINSTCRSCRYWNEGTLINPCYECKSFLRYKKEDRPWKKAWFAGRDLEEKEMVNKPDHYGGDMVLTFIEEWEALPNSRANFSRTTAFKYLFRAGLKFEDKEIEDLQKVIFYANREIERLEKLKNPIQTMEEPNADSKPES